MAMVGRHQEAADNTGDKADNKGGEERGGGEFGAAPLRPRERGSAPWEAAGTVRVVPA